MVGWLREPSIERTYKYMHNLYGLSVSRAADSAVSWTDKHIWASVAFS